MFWTITMFIFTLIGFFLAVMVSPLFGTIIAVVASMAFGALAVLSLIGTLFKPRRR